MRLARYLVMGAVIGAVLTGFAADANVLVAIPLGAVLGAVLVLLWFAFPRQLGNPDLEQPGQDD